MLTNAKTLRKLKAIEARYATLRYEKIAEIPLEMWETAAHFRREPTAADGAQWRPVKAGDTWGFDFGTAWFRGDVDIPAAAAGEPLFLHALLGQDKPEPNQILLFVDGRPHGVLDFMHHYVRVTPGAPAGTRLHIALEAYASHSYPKVWPDEEPVVITPGCRTIDRLELHRERRDVTQFVYDLRTLRQLAEKLPEHSLRRNRVAAVLEQVFAVVDAKPVEAGIASWRPRLQRALALMQPQLALRNGPTTPEFGLVGHSHIDTAWLWPIAETHRKSARTFSSVLNLLDQYPEMVFIQSAPYHLEMVRRQYPDIFERVVKAYHAGQWEPNGAVWIEPDCNIPSGESLARQLLHGQRATREWFGYTSDTLWQPDVFGYSAALPQILAQAGVRYFCTTKMSWNDTTRFPYDTFHWQGIDGTRLLAHFNTIHAEPEPEWLIANWEKQVQHKDVQDRHLAGIGWGDGGGGPTEALLEMARRTADLEGCPRVRHTSVSAFMRGIERDLDRLPTYVGELYLELHRGTLTSIAGIKRGNRKTEIALREAEYLAVRAGLAARAPYPAAALDTLWKDFLVKQFHDILPGTSIAVVHDEALADFARYERETAALAAGALDAFHPAGGDALALSNSLSWARSRDISVPATVTDRVPTDPSVVWQRIEHPDGTRSLALSGLTIPPLASVVLPLADSPAKASPAATVPYHFAGDVVTTPHHRVRFDAVGRIASLVTLADGREWVRPGGLFNNLLLGEDVPEFWDNWDIDADQELKLEEQTRLESSEVSALGPLQCRIRRVYTIGAASRLVQDVILHTDHARIDFETIVDWHEKYRLLKVGFDINVMADSARYEIQFGHVERPTHRNLPEDRARFEVAHHRWADLSDNGSGVALLNDCKYGIGVRGSSMRLSLLKSGLHPDPRGDEGTHRFTYAVLPHGAPFSVESVVRPAAELNIPVVGRSTTMAVAGLESLLTIDAPNVIVEAIKGAEDGRGYIVRLYEAGRRSTRATLTPGHPVVAIEEVNLLEEKQRDAELRAGAVVMDLRPFEIRSLRIVPG